MLMEKNSEIIYKKYEVGHLQMLYEESIKPFLDPLINLFHNLVPKLFLGVLLLSGGLIELGQSLFQSSETWVLGISILVAIDFVAGSLRAATEPEIKFSFKRWIKTAYKIASYSMALSAVVVASNMFPKAMGWLQYVAFCLLTANELRSIFKNLKLSAVGAVLWDMMMNKAFDVDSLSQFKTEVDKRSLEQFKESQEQKYTRFKIDQEINKNKP